MEIESAMRGGEMDAPLKSSKEDKTSGQTAAVGPNHTGMWHLPATSLIYLNPRCGDKPAAGHIYLGQAMAMAARGEKILEGGDRGGVDSAWSRCVTGGPWKKEEKKEKKGLT